MRCNIVNVPGQGQGQGQNNPAAGKAGAAGGLVVVLLVDMGKLHVLQINYPLHITGIITQNVISILYIIFRMYINTDMLPRRG